MSHLRAFFCRGCGGKLVPQTIRASIDPPNTRKCPFDFGPGVSILRYSSRNLLKMGTHVWKPFTEREQCAQWHCPHHTGPLSWPKVTTDDGRIEQNFWKPCFGNVATIRELKRLNCKNWKISILNTRDASDKYQVCQKFCSYSRILWIQSIPGS